MDKLHVCLFALGLSALRPRPPQPETSRLAQNSLNYISIA